MLRLIIDCNVMICSHSGTAGHTTPKSSWWTSRVASLTQRLGSPKLASTDMGGRIGKGLVVSQSVQVEAYQQ
jgi:hypothetical protein